MRIQLGSPPRRPVEPENPNVGRPIRQPGKWASVLLASMTGVIVLVVSYVLLVAVKQLLPPGASYPKTAIPWAGMIAAFFLCVFAHEGLHILLHPDSGHRLAETAVRRVL